MRLMRMRSSTKSFGGLRAAPQPETPLLVIDEAIEIAKRFSTAPLLQFINGILDGVLKSPAARGPDAS